MAVFQGMVAAVPGHQGGGLQKRRKRCCPVFPIALLQGHWVVLEEKEQHTVCEMNSLNKNSLIQDHYLAKFLTFFPVFHRFTSESVTSKLKLNIFAHLNSPLKILGGGCGGGIFHLSSRSLKFHPSKEHDSFVG